MRVARWSRWSRRARCNPRARRTLCTRWGTATALGALLAACVSSWSPGGPLPYHRTALIADAEPVGASECEDCHDEVQGRAVAPLYHADCETCHGPGSLHVDSAEPELIRFPANADCLACHETGHASHLAWQGSEHARAGVLCSDCHATHNREPQHVREAARVAGPSFADAQGTTRLCVSCHPEVASRLDLPSHHPVREGLIGCTDCHAPHESQQVALGARTARCTRCHQDLAGPWIFEHPPAAEDCGYCHTPHGSVTSDLLETSQPATCIACHSLAVTGAGHGTQAFTTRCTDCHNAVHGSYVDPHLRR